MKITKSQLKKLIREELERAELSESEDKTMGELVIKFNLALKAGNTDLSEKILKAMSAKLEQMREKHPKAAAEIAAYKPPF